MKKRMMVLGAAAALWAAQAGWCGETHHGGHAAEKGKQSLQGEVLDMACYMAHEGKGSAHKKCALQCIKDGAPAGLLTKDGQVYLLVEDHGAKAAYQGVKGLAAEQVKVTGPVSSRGGVQAITVQAAEKVQ